MRSGYAIGNKTGFWGRFLDLFVSLPVRVKERPDLWGRSGFETHLTLQNVWFFNSTAREGVAVSPFADEEAENGWLM